MISLLAVTFLLATNPTTVQAERLVKEGDRLLGSERFELALQTYREAIKVDPLMMMAHYGAGQAQMALKQYPDAIKSFRDAREAFAARKAENLALHFDVERVRQDRIQALRDKIRENQERILPPGSPEERERDRRLQEWDVQIQSLQRDLNEARESVEPPPGLALALGSAYFRSGQMKEAEEEYRVAIRLQPKLGEPRNNLAVVLFLTGRAAEAQVEVAAAEKSGFKVASGLKKDIESALSAASAKP